MNRLATALTGVIIVAQLSRAVLTAHADSASFTFQDEQGSSIWRYLGTRESAGAQYTSYHFGFVIANKTSNIAMAYHNSESHELKVGGEDSAFVQSDCRIYWVGKVEGNRVSGNISGSYTISADFWNYPTNPKGGFSGTFNGRWRGEMYPSGHALGTFEMTWSVFDSWGAFSLNPQIVSSLNCGNGEALGSWRANFSALGEPSTTLVFVGGALAVAIVCASFSWRFFRSRKRLFRCSVTADTPQSVCRDSVDLLRCQSVG